jgi:hypothetical protein
VDVATTVARPFECRSGVDVNVDAGVDANVDAGVDADVDVDVDADGVAMPRSPSPSLDLSELRLLVGSTGALAAPLPPSPLPKSLVAMCVDAGARVLLRAWRNDSGGDNSIAPLPARPSKLLPTSPQLPPPPPLRPPPPLLLRAACTGDGVSAPLNHLSGSSEGPS